jgi:hypothetical protein
MRKPRNSIIPPNANMNTGTVKKESAGDTSKNTDEAAHAIDENRVSNRALPRNILEKPRRSKEITNINRVTTTSGICKEASRNTKA